jgi:hypothetical protein
VRSRDRGVPDRHDRSEPQTALVAFLGASVRAGLNFLVACPPRREIRPNVKASSVGLQASPNQATFELTWDSWPSFGVVDRVARCPTVESL